LPLEVRRLDADRNLVIGADGGELERVVSQGRSGDLRGEAKLLARVLECLDDAGDLAEVVIERELGLGSIGGNGAWEKLGSGAVGDDGLDVPGDGDAGDLTLRGFAFGGLDEREGAWVPWGDARARKRRA